VAWWAQYPIDPLRVARELWERSHPKRASPAAVEGEQVASATTPEVARDPHWARRRMTTWQQIAANRRNAEKSTGPRTDAGKRRSRRNALRHGLCAETVIESLEDVEDYKAFEIAIASEYDAQSVVERELVLRLYDAERLTVN
jgi:hypothetical protein